MIKHFLWTLAKYLLAIGVLSYVLYSNWEPATGRGLKDVWFQQSLDGTYLLLAFLVHLFSLTITVFRWYLLVRAQDLPFTIAAAFRISTLGFLFNAFLPGSVGGDVIKAAALARQQDRQTVAVATVIMDRALSLWGLVALVALVGAAGWSLGFLNGTSLGASRVVIVAAVVSIAISTALWLGMGLLPAAGSEQLAANLGRIPAIGAAVSQLWEAVWLYRLRPASIGWGLVLTTISNGCDIIAFYLYASCLWDGAPTNPLPSLMEHFLLVPVGLVISGVPLFPGGAGIGEAGFGGLYALFGSAAANGVLGSLLFRVSGWGIGIVGYLMCTLWPSPESRSQALLGNAPPEAPLL